LPQVVGAQEELNTAFTILDVGKGDLAHRAQAAQAARQGCRYDGRGLFTRRLCGGLGGFELADGFLAGVGTLGARGEGLNATGAQAFQFFQAVPFQVGVFVCHFLNSSA